ncbi:MAG: OmpA family protein [Patescibacteria group bacterium]
MSTLRLPLVGFLFCAAALLPLAAIAQDEGYVPYDGTDFSWMNDVQPEQLAEDQSLWSDPLWDIAGEERLLPEQGWDYAGFENVEQYVVVPPQELFRPYEALIEPLFDTQRGDNADWADLTIWNSTESQDQEQVQAWFEFNRSDDTLWAQQLEFEAGQQADYEFNRTDSALWTEQAAWEEQQQQEQAWFEFNRSDDTLWAQQLEFEAGQQADYEFNRVDGTLWAEQVAWEERQAREQAFIDSTLDAEATAWQRKGMDELTPFEVELLRAQEQQDAFNAAAPDPDREARGPLSCVWGSGDCDPFSLKVMRPTAEESKGTEQAWFEFSRSDDTLWAQQLEFEAGQRNAANGSQVNNNFGWPIDVGRGAEQCIDAGNTSACSKAYVDWTVAQTRFGNTALPENVAPQQPSTFRAPVKAAEESTVDRLKKDPLFGFFLNTVPDAYDATKERLTGWYDSLTNSVPPAASGGGFAERFQGEDPVWNNDPAAQEALLKEWASRTDVDSRLTTREALPAPGAPLGNDPSTPFPQVERTLSDGALPFGMSVSDGRLEINRNADAQSPQEFEEYKKYNLINEATQYGNTKYPVIVDFGDKAIVLRGEEYGLQGNGVGVVRGNNLGNFNFGWDTTVGQKAEGTFVNGFAGYGDDGIAARGFLGNVNPETNQTIAQDVAKEIRKYESEKGFFGRTADSFSLAPSTVSVEGFTQSGDKFFVQDIVGPYDNRPPDKKEIKEIILELVAVAPKEPEPVSPQVVSESPAAPPAPASAPADAPEPSTVVAPLPEPVEVGKMDVKEAAPALPPAAAPGADPLPCLLCSTEVKTPSPLPEPEMAPPEEAPQGNITPTENKILSELKEPVAATPTTPTEENLLDKLQTSGNAAPSAEDRREISDIIKGRPKADVEVNFALDSAAIDDKAKIGLSQIGNVLSREEFKDRTILINGYTDAFGGPDYNLKLSQRRAEAIKQYLVAEFNLDPDRLIAVGFGREQLKYPNTPFASGNRRVQIVIAK